MKSFRALFLVLIINYFLLGQGGFSIESSISYLQKIGRYDIIQLLKIYVGEDVAIGFCMIYILSIDICSSIVRNYMLPYDPPKNFELELKLPINASESFNNTVFKLYKESDNISKRAICIIINNYDILIEEMSENEIIKLIKKTIYRNNYISKK